MSVLLSIPITVVPYLRGDGICLTAEVYYCDSAIPNGLGIGTTNQSLLNPTHPLRSISIFYVVRKWFNNHELYRTLLDELQWNETYIKLYDKVIRSPRLVHFCGDLEADQSRFHNYSSYAHEIQKWHPSCEWIRDAINYELGIRYNSCLLNYYKDGNDYIAYHGDKEANDPLKSVATVSLGSTRRFYLQDNSTKEVTKIELNSGDLAIMTGNLQHTHKHSIPKQAGVGGRISITFRSLQYRD